jgi:hypothetical protein
MENEPVNCFQCVHFAVSWDPKFPKSCKLFGFKTAGLPSVSVWRDSGAPCHGFQQKAAANKTDGA